MGAKIIEKHITFDRNLKGPDHKASSTIREFDKLVKAIRKIEIVKGNSENNISKLEKGNSQCIKKEYSC